MEQRFDLSPTAIRLALSKAWLWIIISAIVGSLGFGYWRSAKEPVSAITAIIFSNQTADLISFLASQSVDPKILIAPAGGRLLRVELHSVSRDAQSALDGWVGQSNAFLLKNESKSFDEIERAYKAHFRVVDYCDKNQPNDLNSRHLCALSAAELARLNDLRSDNQTPIQVLSVKSSKTKVMYSVVRDAFFGAIVGIVLSIFTIGLVTQWRTVSKTSL